MDRFLRYLATWSRSQFIIVSVLWVAVVLLSALLTPPARYMTCVDELARMLGNVNILVPMHSLRLLAILTPLIAFGPPLGLIPLWRRARRTHGPTRAA